MSEPRERLTLLLEEAIRVAAMDPELAEAQSVLCLVRAGLADGSLPFLADHCGPFARRQLAEARRRLEEGR